MNPGTFVGAGSGATGGAISRYVQTPTISTSQIVPVPSGVQRIEALLVGGGGGGTYGNGGGFGGAAIIEIPVTGSPLSVVVGAGGVPGARGGTTKVYSAGTLYGAVGGGGGANGSSYYRYVPAGKLGGGGAGATMGYISGMGGLPPIGKLIWTCYPGDSAENVYVNNGLDGHGIFAYSSSQYAPGNVYYSATVPTGAGQGSRYWYSNASNQGVVMTPTAGSFGGGGGGGTYAVRPSYGGGGGDGGSGVFGGGGSGRAYQWDANYQSGGSGGSLTAMEPVWGYTGKAGGSGLSYYSSAGGGGGGLLSAGSNYGTYGYNSSTETYYATGGNGGNGGGGGGGGIVTGTLGGYGSGGDGFAAIRFYF